MRHKAKGMSNLAQYINRELGPGSSQSAVHSSQSAVHSIITSTLSPRLLTLLIFLVFSLVSSSQIFSQVAWNKKGGVAFRIDDNHPLWKYISFDSLFSIYGFKFCPALNLESADWYPGYIESLKPILANGNELMDHSPNHSTCLLLLTNIEDTAIYYGNSFVDHINGNRICFKWESMDTTTIQGEGPVNIYENLVISVLPGEFHDLYNPQYLPMLNIPLTGQIYTWSNLYNLNPLDPDTLTLLSLWEETVSLGIHAGIPYHKLTSFDVKLPQEVLVMLGERTLAICNKYSLARPFSWIQPFGAFPLLYKDELAQSMGALLGYTGGATYNDESYKTYNEYNPINDKQFAMMFGDFRTPDLTAKENKNLIANGIAKHQLLIDQNHFTVSSADWPGYIKRTDSILSWLSANNIPVLTQREWTAMLFDSVTNPSVNIFPLLQTDLNEDQIPDGYQLDEGVMIHDDGVSQSDNKSIQISSTGNLFRIYELGGLEKGTNHFTFYSKGSPGNVLYFWITYPETGGSYHIDFLADEASWTQHTTTIDIPEDISVVDIEMECHTYTSGEVRVSGMELRGVGRPVVSHESLTIMTNQQFPALSLDTIISDPTFSLQELTISVSNPGSFGYDLDIQSGTLTVYKPYSFWKGSDSLMLKVVNPLGGADSAWLSFTAIQTEICKGQSITLTVLNPPADATFLWTSDPKDYSMTSTTIYNPTVTPEQTTNYTVAITSQGLTEFEYITVSVYQGGNANLSGPLPAYCANASPVELFGEPPGGTFSGPGVSGNYFYPGSANTGKNMLYYTVSDPGGCDGQDSMSVIIQPIPKLTLPSDTVICYWQTISLDGGSGFDSYLWSTGETTSSVYINASGMGSDSTRQIVLIVTKDGCPAIDTTIVSFKACTGIGSVLSHASCFLVYPNPVSSSLFIENICLNDPVSGKIFDIVGREKLTLQIDARKTNLDIGFLPAGVYILSINGPGISTITRFVKVE